MTERELLEELEKGLSDVDVLNSDEESDEEELTVRRRVGDPDPDPSEYEEAVDFSNDYPVTAETEIDFDLPQEGFEENEIPNDRSYVVTDKKDIKWMNNVHFETMHLRVHNPIDEMRVEDELYPIDYFMRYIPESLYETFAELTNIYSLQKNDNNFAPTTAKEIKSRWLCQKCNVHLCLQKDRNCFKLFHTK